MKAMMIVAMLFLSGCGQAYEYHVSKCGVAYSLEVGEVDKLDRAEEIYLEIFDSFIRREDSCKALSGTVVDRYHGPVTRTGAWRPVNRFAIGTAQSTGPGMKYIQLTPQDIRCTPVFAHEMFHASLMGTGRHDPNDHHKGWGWFGGEWDPYSATYLWYVQMHLEFPEEITCLH